ncbi:MAG: hypothetical protein NZ901_10080 [Geminocystis sp.]|nr:hypothetical protein [Geminocystis sp.]HIK36878.1 hypothetical protein [Geminocystis sp. M7585_C2015_104]MCS7148522.1 hypothetical protein [Geminocystis sp.]MCX8079478.1 hypothetical protein [Geminocystis sp.]MDW8114905.1 hypothetical protein [Geminocystis sp.]
MSQKIVWDSNSNEIDNPTNLGLIREWWENLNRQKILQAQRIIPPGASIDQLDWDTKQRFDQEYILLSPQIRGITVYGTPEGQAQEFGYTARRLELDLDNKSLSVYLQSQPDTVIRFSLVTTRYERITLKDVEIGATREGSDLVLSVRDKDKKIEIVFGINTGQQDYLLSRLKEIQES